MEQWYGNGQAALAEFARSHSLPVQNEAVAISAAKPPIWQDNRRRQMLSDERISRPRVAGGSHSGQLAD